MKEAGPSRAEKDVYIKNMLSILECHFREVCRSFLNVVAFAARPKDAK